MSVFLFFQQVMQETIFLALMEYLEELKDEKVECTPGDIGQTLEWTEETGKVKLTVRKLPFLSVNATVKTTPLWQEYMDNRLRNGIRPRFYFDEDEDVYEFRVNNVADVTAAAREMQYLNWLRLNWLQQKTDRRLVLAMGLHSRLGAGSPISNLEDGILQAIAKLL